MANPAPSLAARLKPAQLQALDHARAQLLQARSTLTGAQRHRSLLSARWSGAHLLVSLLMALLPCCALLALQASLFDAWQTLLLWWSERLQLPLTLAHTGNAPTLVWLAGGPNTQLPSWSTGLWTAVAVATLYAGTHAMSDRQLPLKYLVRVLCGVQASALVFFLLAPSAFAYTLTGHLRATLDAGFVLMLILPVLLMLGWGVLRLPLYQRLLCPPLMLAYFAVMVPHKALLHLVILQQLSVLFMPLLYLCLGTVLDLMIFVALYSWLASLAPSDAVLDES